MPTTIALPAGDLKYRVTLQRQVNTVNALGEEVPQWVDVVTVWADVRPLTTRQWVAAMQMQTSITHEVIMRWRPVDVTWRLKLVERDELYDIVGEPVVIGRRVGLRINVATRQRDARP